MTEAEWNACTDPEPMFEFLRGRGNHSERKARLFVFGSCRVIWHLLTDERSQRGVQVAEQFLEGGIGQEELEQARFFSHAAYMDARASEAMAAGHSPESEWAHRNAAAIPFAAYTATCCDTPGNVYYEVGCVIGERLSPLELDQSCLFRDIFGPLPFRPVALNPAWISPTVKQLGEAIYEEKAFDRMPILGDALEESGCSNADILNHCRQPGEHCRGCWVVDLILGKS